MTFTNGSNSSLVDKKDKYSKYGVEIVKSHTEDPSLNLMNRRQSHVPPEKGIRGWIVVFASFLVNGIIFGSINSFGILFVELKNVFHDVSDVSSKVSLVGSLAIGATFFCSPISGVLTDKLGIQQSAFLGAVISTIGMLLSSIVYHHLEALYFTFLLFGIGSSIIYTPSLAILAHYFHKNIGLVNGIVTAGSSVFTIIMPHLLRVLLNTVGLQGTFFFLTGMVAVLLISSITFRPLFKPTVQESDEDKKHFLKSHLNLSVLKNKQYVIWASGIGMALLGYFIPYVHLPAYVGDLNKQLDKNFDGGFLLTCIGLTSGIGRIVFGKMSDMKSVNPVILQQIAFFSIGVSTMLLTLAPLFQNGAFIFLGFIALIMGLFDGCFISLLGPIAFKFCGAKGASQAIGFLLGITSLPLTLGPPIAGILYDHMKSYKVPFLMAGIPPIVGATFLFLLLKFRKNEGNQSNENQVQTDDLLKDQAMA